MDGCQPVVPCGRGAIPLVKDPIEIASDILPSEMLEEQSLYSDTIFGMHVVDILDKGISIRGQGVWADIAFMGQILGQEPAKLFGKVCRCLQSFGYTKAFIAEHWRSISGYIA